MSGHQFVSLGEKPYGVSPSRVNQIETCPKQYYFSTVLRIPEPKKMETYRGTVFHAVLEEMFKRTADTPHERTVDYTLALMREMFRGLVTPEYAAEMGIDEVGIQAFGRDLAKYIRTYFTLEDPTQITSEGIEIAFDIDMGGYILRGVLDRLDRLPTGELEIVDYKTGKVPQDRYKDSALLPTKIYAYMCREQLGEVPKQIRLLYVQYGKTLTVEVTDADINYAERRVREAWAKIENWYELGFFPPIANNLCEKWCSFKAICPLFATPEVTPF
jgi:putative RecB family exonuclease